MLTEALAAHGDANDSAELKAIAHELIGARGRTRVADGIERVVREAAGPARPLTAAVPLDRREIIAAREELAALAQRLRAPAPVTAHGLGLADRLRDGASPIYDRGAAHSMWRLARTARERLDDPIG